MHWARWRRTGSVDGIPARPADERFWEKVKEQPDGCWLWTGYIDRDGYGLFGKARGESVRAVRFAYEWVVGAIRPGLTLDHLCRVRACVNPAHLEPIGRGENVLRGTGLTAENARKTRCAHGHPFDEANTYHWRGSRYCKTCRRLRQRKQPEHAGTR
jgi:hypothetical protein